MLYLTGMLTNSEEIWAVNSKAADLKTCCYPFKINPWKNKNILSTEHLQNGKETLNRLMMC